MAGPMNRWIWTVPGFLCALLAGPRAAQAQTFSITTTGTPSPSLSETGPLPSGVTFVSNGNGTATLSGTAASGEAAVGPSRTTRGTPGRRFTLTDRRLRPEAQERPQPAAGNFTITATGTPTPSMTGTALFRTVGVRQQQERDGDTERATAAGQPQLPIDHGNSVGPGHPELDATVSPAPASARPESPSRRAPLRRHGGQRADASVAETGALPNGVTFVDTRSTATLSGTRRSGPPAATRSR
jgi:hypothetical protein